MGKTLPEKVWERHVVHAAAGEPDLLYIDLHLIHEVTSPQAFDGLRLAGRKVRRPDLTIATEDHNVPTVLGPIADPVSKAQVETLRKNAAARRLTGAVPGPAPCSQHRLTPPTSRMLESGGPSARKWIATWQGAPVENQCRVTLMQFDA